MDVKELTPAELDLCGYAPGDVILRDNAGTGQEAGGVERDPGAQDSKPRHLRSGSASSFLVLTPRAPVYSADIRHEAVVARGTLEEDYSFICTPAGGKAIDRLVVRFSSPRPAPSGGVVHESGHWDAPLMWSVEGMDDTRFAARRWKPAQEKAAGLTKDEEAWDLTFGNRPLAPLKCAAVRKTKLSGPLALRLASLPEAASQQATVVIRSLGPQAVQFAAHRVTPLPIDQVPADQVQTVRAAYRYDARLLERARRATTPRPSIVLTAVTRVALPPGHGTAKSARTTLPTARSNTWQPTLSRMTARGRLP